MKFKVIGSYDDAGRGFDDKKEIKVEANNAMLAIKKSIDEMFTSRWNGHSPDVTYNISAKRLVYKPSKMDLVKSRIEDLEKELGKLKIELEK